MNIARLIPIMGIAAVFACTLGAARPAAADGLPGWFTVTPPGGWMRLDERAEEIAADLRQDWQLGTTSFQARASVWASAPPPATAGAAFLISWIETTEPVDDADAAVQAQLERVRTIPDRASLPLGRTAFDEWKKTADRGVVYALLAWRHLDDQTESVLRTAIVQAASGELYQVSAECVRSTSDTGGKGGNDQAWQRCRRAQGSLAITLGQSQRRSLDAIGQQAAPGTGVTPADGLGAGSTLRLTDPGPLGGSEVPPIAVARAQQSNYRLWLYVVGAVLVLIGVYTPFRSQLRSRAKADEDEWEEDSELHRVVRRAKSHGGIDSGAAKEKE